MKGIFTKKRGKTGFTLIELLITITIIGIISITTFAIVMSAMNTFKKEQDVMDANSFKDDICLILKGHLRKRQRMSLLNENLAHTEGYNPTGATDVIFGEEQKDIYGYYVIDPRLEEMHMIYSENGRVYTVDSNLDGKYYIDAKCGVDAKAVTPSMMLVTDPANKRSEISGQYGGIPLMTEDLYYGYYVDLKFKPIFNNVQGRYRDLQIVVTVYDDASMTEAHQVAKGTETFHLLNVENMQSAIKFYNDTATQAANPSNKLPETNGYKFCYFA